MKVNRKLLRVSDVLGFVSALAAIIFVGFYGSGSRVIVPLCVLGCFVSAALYRWAVRPMSKSWLESDQHRMNCAACSEGQQCCLEKFYGCDIKT